MGWKWGAVRGKACQPITQMAEMGQNQLSWREVTFDHERTHEGQQESN
jgi:hypothetical protein